MQSRYQHGQRTWAESSSLHRFVLRWLIQSYFEGNIPLFLTMPGRKVYVVGVGMTKVSDMISFVCKSGPIWSYVKCYDPAAMMSQLAIKWTRLNPIVLYTETMFSSLKSLADEKILIILIWLKKQVCSFVPCFVILYTNQFSIEIDNRAYLYFQW